MKRLIVSVLLLLIATFLFSQAKSDSSEGTAENGSVNEPTVLVQNSP
ncbi:hypothetical protein [Formosa sp. S-31]